MEPRIVPASAIPTVGLTVAPQALIGSNVQFTASFQNTSATQTGYGPFLDLELPTVGTGTNNGLTFTGATYLGSSVKATVETFDAQGHATNPMAFDSSGNPVVITGTPGDQLVILTLPFGSVTPGQPTTDVTINASMSNQATLGTPLNISAVGGFEFGNDPLNDPTTDPSILGASASASVTPTLVSVKATYLGPEQETATGPNFQEQYQITASVAPGQTINNLQLNDILPAGMQFVSLGTVSGNGSASHSTVSAPSTTTPGGTLSVQFDKIVGTGGPNDATMTFTFYVPRDDSSSNPVLNLSTGTFTTLQDQANATGSWTPVGGTSAVSVTSATATDTITAKSIAVQQSVVDLTNPTSPRSGDVLQYTIQFQVSDFFAFAGAIANASFSDGQAFNSSFAPTLSFTQGGSNSSAAIQAANYSVGPQNTSPSDGSTPITFDISNELAALGISGGNLLGASIPAGGTGGPEPSATPSTSGTVGTIVYETTIQQQFNYNYPAGQPYVVEGDVLNSSVTTTGTVLSYSNLATTATTQTDNSGTQVKIPRGVLTESIYAINGNTSVGATPKIAADDAITYELKYSLPTSNVDLMSLSSFLPLPINVATGITTFNATQSATAPAVGQAQFGPSDTFYSLSSITPTVSTNATANSVTFNYGSYHNSNQDATVVDILFTVSVSNQPFADGLILTNEAQEVESSTNGGTATAQSIVQLQLTEPVLTITHGIVATNDSTSTVATSPYTFSAPGSTGPRFTGTITSGDLATNPITGGLTGLQAGDLVTFAIVVQNTGSGLNGAYDVTLADSLPAGFVIPTSGLNLSVTDGTGAALSVSNVGGGTGLFGQGIEVTNSNTALGTLSAYSATSGTNLMVITYDLQAADTITPTESIPVQASLTGFAASEGGPNFVSTPETATATATTPAVTMTKVIASTNQSFTTGNNLAIGEIATYNVTIAIPEGITPSAQLVDTLPAGLAIVQVDSITPSANVTTSSSTSTIAANGSSVTFNLGTITNSDRTKINVDTVTIAYDVVVLNVSSNQQGTTLTNAADFTYTGGSVTASATATVVVPKLTLSVTQSQATAQAGDTETYTITVANPTGANGSDAYNVSLSDVLPTSVTYVAGTLTNTGGTAATSASVSGSTATLTFSSMALGATSTYTLQATVNGTVQPYQTWTNSGQATWASIPGNVTTAQSTYSVVSTQRDGNTSDPGGTANNLLVTKSATFATVKPTIATTILTTDLASTTGNNLAIGETVQYQTVVTIPNGVSPSAVLTLTLTSGLAIVSLDSIAATGSLSTTYSGGFSGGLAAATVASGGGSASIPLGDITNSSTTDTPTQTITVDWTAVALDVIGNQEATSLTASAKLAVTGGSASGNAPATTIVVPLVKMAMTPSLSTVQAGDTVTYTLVVSNTSAGGSGADAYNLDITTSFPTGLSYVTGSLANSSGTAPTTISDSGGSPVFDFTDLALGQTSTFTFQATVQGSTGPYQTLSTTASSTYTSIPTNPTTQQSTYNTASTGRTYVQASTVDNLGSTASAPVTTKLPALVETITSTSLSTTAGTSVAIGELVHYELTVTVPDGTTSNASISEAFPAGLTLVSLDGLTASAPLSTSISGGFAGALSAATVGASGGSFTIDLGTITNANTNTAQTQTLVLDFTGVVLNVATNTAGTALADAATYAGNGGSEPASTSVSVVEPHVGVTLARSAATGDAGGSAITFTIVVTATTGTGANAYGVSLADALPSGYTYVNSTLTNTAGTVPTTLSDANGTMSATFADLAPGASSTLQFQAVLSGTTSPGQVVSDGVATTYASLPGGVTSPESTYNALSVQRDGTTSDPGGAANNYAASASVSVTVNANTISGVVFNDINNDGIQQAGEAGLASVSVFLTGRDNLGNSVSLSTTTAANGSYSFGSLRPGTYAVSITPPAGYQDGQDVPGTPFGGSSPSANLLSGLTIPLGTNAPGTGYNFAELLPASIAGQVFSDTNNNGVVNTGEPGIAGVTITLSGTNDQGTSVSLSTTTDTTGAFSFAGLRPGTYTVTETAPSGYLPGTNGAGNTGGTFTGTALGGIVLAQGTAASGITYAELAPASIGGSIYLDSNNNGVMQAGEPGVAGVVVTLTGTNDLGNAINTAVLSGTNGAYSFGGLRPGTYAVTETTPSGLLSGLATVGTSGGSTSALDLVSGVALTPGALGTGYNLGLLQTSAISGSVYIDAANSGAMQAGDAGISGVTIALSGTNDLGNSVSLTTTTATGGAFAFPGLRPGTYTVTETPPTGYLPGTDTAGTLGGTVGTGTISSITTTSGATGTGYNFAELLPASIAGQLFSDTNDNGVPNPGEPGISGVTIALSGTNDQGTSVNLTTTTTSTGAFSFAGLRPGTYTVTETPPTGYLPGTNGAGNSGGTFNGTALGGIVLAQGTAASEITYAELPPASIAGSVYIDSQDAGSIQTGDPGTSGVTITLAGTNDLGQPVSLSTTTATDGTYGFNNLRPGNYSLTETAPAGYLAGAVTAGSSGGTVGSAAIAAIPIAAGASGTGYNFGELNPATIAGLVYNDTNDNGVVNTGESGISGVTVRLSGTNDQGASINLTTTTDGTGAFSFPGLRPGTYTVTETPPAGDLPGTNGAGNSGGTFSGSALNGVVLGQGTVASGITFAQIPGASIGGTVYIDTQDAGSIQTGDPGIAGVTLTLTGTNDLGLPVAATTTTASDGTYGFVGLRPGTYAITETAPAGYLAGAVSVGTLGGTSGSAATTSIPIGAGATGTGYNFAELTPASIAGQVFNDINNNGVVNSGEPGIAGVTIVLSGTSDLGQQVSLTTTTDGTGAFAFNDLRPGTYTVTETPPAGDLPGTNAAGNSGGTFNGPTLNGVVLGQGTAASGITFAELVGAQIAGMVYLDANSNGTMQAGEPGVAGAIVTLTGTNDLGNSVSASVLSGSNGSYAFAGLRPGTYNLATTTPSGELAGQATIGTAGGTITALDTVSGVTVGVGSTGTGYDLGLLDSASLSGAVLAGGCNCGIADVPVTLTGTNDLGNTVQLTTTTAPDGSYHFADLRPGTYAIAAATPTGDITGQAIPGTPNATAGLGQLTAIHLAEGVCGVHENFVAYAPAGLSGFVYNDVNGSGTRQPSDPGIAGATVTLTGTNDMGVAVDLTTKTAADGSFAFAGLIPGTYQVTETVPTGYLAGQDTAGTAGGAAVAGASAISNICLTDGAAATGYLFANLAPSTISGVVNSPANAGVSGAVVTLTGIDALGHSVTRQETTSNGSYSFAGLLPGTYDLAVSLPSNNLSLLATTGTQGGVAGVNKIENIALKPGVAAVDYAFAAATYSSVSGSIYLDVNDSGTRQPTDPGLAGVAVTLSGTTTTGQPVSMTTAAAADGSYAFHALASGSYTVDAVPPSGDLLAKGSTSSRSLTLGSGQSASFNVGLIRSASLSGTVYLDARHRGAFLPSDFGIAGVPIVLTGTNDLGQSVTERTITGPNGTYTFAGLRPGVYSVERGSSPAFAGGRADVGTLGGKWAGTRIDRIDVAGGQQGQGYDFGQRLKFGCVLDTPAFHRLVLGGPHPTRPIVSGHRSAGLPRVAPPLVSRWLPTLADMVASLVEVPRHHRR